MSVYIPVLDASACVSEVGVINCRWDDAVLEPFISVNWSGCVLQAVVSFSGCGGWPDSGCGSAREKTTLASTCIISDCRDIHDVVIILCHHPLSYCICSFFYKF